MHSVETVGQPDPTGRIELTNAKLHPKLVPQLDAQGVERVSVVGQRLAHLKNTSIDDLRFIGRKWLWEFLFVGAAVSVAVLLYIMLFRDPMYQSEARLFVRLGQEQAPPRTFQTREGSALLTPTTSDVASEIDLLLNADIISTVIDKTGILEAMNQPAPPPSGLKDHFKAAMKSLRNGVDEVAFALGIKTRVPLREALTRQIRLSLGLDHKTGSNVIVLTMRWPDRGVPQPLLTAFLEAFQQFRLDAFQENDVSYFTRQRDAASLAIAEIENDIAALRITGGIEDIETQRKLLLSALEQTMVNGRNAALQLSTAQRRLELLEAPRDIGGPVMLANLPDQALLRSLDERSIQEHANLAQARSMPSLDGRNAAALSDTLESLRISTLRALREHVALIAANQADAVAYEAELRARLVSIAENEARWNELHTKRKLAVETFENYANRLTEAQSVDGLRKERLGNIVLVQEPTETTLSPGARNALILAVGGVFALLGALSWVAIREFLDRRIWRSSELAAQTDVPLLGETLRHRGPARSADYAIAAAALRRRCSKGHTTLAFIALDSDPLNPGSRTRALALALLDQGINDVRIVNLNRWGGAESRVSALDARLTEEVFADQSSALTALGRIESASKVETGGKQSVTLLAAPPLFSGPVGLRAAQAADGVVLDVRAGRDTDTTIGAAILLIGQEGGRIMGVILADLAGYAARAGSVR